jgi:hypothetical protein
VVENNWKGNEMSTKRRATMSLADRGSLEIFCLDRDVKDLTREQINALHTLVHEILAAVYRCYQVVPKGDADPILAKFLTKTLN